MDADSIITLVPQTTAAEEVLRQQRSNPHVVAQTVQSLNCEPQEAPSVPLSPGSAISPKPKVHLKFSKPPKNPAKGYLFGSDPQICDVIIGQEKHGISPSHFRICFGRDFNNCRRLALLDHSKLGTTVTLDDQLAHCQRQNFIWLLHQAEGKGKIGVSPGHGLHAGEECFHRIRFSAELPLDEMKEYSLLRASKLERYMALSTRFSSDAIELRKLCNKAGRNGFVPLQVESLMGSEHPLFYVEKQNIGKGGYGTVSRVCNVSTGRVCAAKTIAREKSDNLNEVDILKTVSHKHIIEFLGVTKWEPLSFVMEHAQYGSVHDEHARKGSKPINSLEAIGILEQSLQGLAHAHSKNIVHRDIKPTNLLMMSRRPLYVKICDFGCGQEGIRSSSLAGTEIYRAPEMNPNATLHLCDLRASDVWSMAVSTLQYLCPTGLPYDGDNIESSHRKTKIPAPYVWPQKIIRKTRSYRGMDATGALDIVYTMLNPDHWDRPSAAHILPQITPIWERVAPLLDPHFEILENEPRTQSHYEASTDSDLTPTGDLPVTPTPPTCNKS